MTETAITEQTAGQTAEWKTIRLQVIERVENLPSLSTVVHEFMALSKREYFTAKDFERVIIKDQGLVARLLKVANSGFFGTNREIKTIPEAVVLVGLDNMKNMVFAVSTGGMMRQELRSYLYPDKGFWLHAMGVGMTSRALCEAARSVTFSGEEAFVAGLLHDVAKLTIDEFLDPTAGPRPITPDEEKAACGMDHTELAEHVMKMWKLPQAIADAVRFHHTPLQGDQWHEGAAVVQLADIICNTWGIGTQALMDLGEDIDPDEHAELLEKLGISGQDLPKLLLMARQKLANLQNSYDD
ncbi:MAG: HDOD domain-containing protein [bacterium]